MKTSTKIFFAKYLLYFIRFFIKFLGKNAEKLIVKRNNIFFLLNLFEGIDFAVIVDNLTILINNLDEVDSILVDEARTPLIISGQAEDSSALYQEVD